MQRLANPVPAPTHDTRCPSCGTRLDRATIRPPCDNGCPRQADYWHKGQMLCRECALVGERADQQAAIRRVAS